MYFYDVVCDDPEEDVEGISNPLCEFVLQEDSETFDKWEEENKQLQPDQITDDNCNKPLESESSLYDNDNVSVSSSSLSSSYKSFGDDSEGAYEDYSQAFNNLASEKAGYRESPEMKNFRKYENYTIRFGGVNQFYTYFHAYTTYESRKWLEQHQISNGGKRPITKYMGEENIKIKPKACKEGKITILDELEQRHEKSIFDHINILQKNTEEEIQEDDRFIQRQKDIEEAKKKAGEKISEFVSLLTEVFGLLSSDTASKKPW